MSRTALEIMLDPSDRAALERLARSPYTPQGLANRARIVLAAAEGLSNQQIAERLHVSSVTVGKWRAESGPPRLCARLSARSTEEGAPYQALAMKICRMMV